MHNEYGGRGDVKKNIYICIMSLEMIARHVFFSIHMFIDFRLISIVVSSLSGS